MADAKAHEIEKISEAMRNSMDVAVNYNQGSLSMNTEDFDEFVKRTKERLVLQELMKQQNIDSVVDNAYDLLEKLDKVSDEPLDRDWLNRFFNSVGVVSNEQMQKIWGGKYLLGK